MENKQIYSVLHSLSACQSVRKGSSFDYYSPEKKEAPQQRQNIPVMQTKVSQGLYTCVPGHCAPTVEHPTWLPSVLCFRATVFSERPGFWLKSLLVPYPSPALAKGLAECIPKRVLSRPLSNLDIFCLLSYQLHIAPLGCKLNTSLLIAENRSKQHRETTTSQESSEID